MVLSPGYASRRLRTWLFIGLGLSGVIPIMHILAQDGLAYSRNALSLDWLALGGAFYVGRQAFSTVATKADCSRNRRSLYRLQELSYSKLKLLSSTSLSIGLIIICLTVLNEYRNVLLLASSIFTETRTRSSMSPVSWLPCRTISRCVRPSTIDIITQAAAQLHKLRKAKLHEASSVSNGRK